MNDVLFDSYVIRIDHLYSQIPLYTYDFTGDYMLLNTPVIYKTLDVAKQITRNYFKTTIIRSNKNKLLSFS